MSKKNTKVVAVEVKQLGRPVNPNSARQVRLAELAAKAAANGGTVKRGRPAKVKSDEAVEIKAAEGNIE